MSEGELSLSTDLTSHLAVVYLSIIRGLFTHFIVLCVTEARGHLRLKNILTSD